VKLTGPVGRTVGDAIFAVKVTAWPRAEGFNEEVMLAELVVCFTTWFTTADVLPRLFTSPRYTAIIG
jgi:hypothetical protein